MSIWIKYVAPAAIPLAVAASRLRPSPKDDIAAELRSLKTAMPAAQVFSEKMGSPPCYRAYISPQQEPIGLCFTTKDVVPRIVGYAGPIKLMVGLDTSGVLTGVAILEHNETPSYVERMYEPWFTEQFKGKNVSDAFELGKDIDGITRATVTVEAIASSVREGGRKAAEDVLGLEVPGAPAARALSWMEMLLLGGILGVGTIGFLTSKRVLRYLTLIIAAAVLGILYGNFLSAVNLANSLLLRFPPLRSSLSWWVLVGVTGLTTVLFGRVYCGWLCPFGAVEELLGRLRRPKIALSRSSDTKARQLKYWILWLVLIFSLLLASARLTSYEPFATLFNLRGGLVNWGLLGAVLLGALLIFRFWCRYFCPVGAILALVSRVSFVRLRAREKCAGCRLCLDLCPVGAISFREKEFLAIDPGECIQCNECVTACPKRIISRTFRDRGTADSTDFSDSNI